MEKLNLWENLQPLTLEELTKQKSHDSTMSNLLKSIATKSPTISDFINIDSNYIQDIRTLHLHLYKIIHLSRDEESNYINNLPHNEKELLDSFRDIMRNLSIIQETDTIKIQLSQIGQNNFYSEFSKLF